MTAISEVRVGQGFDVHRFGDDPDRVLVLGGVTFDGERPLVGHSDADVPAHAITDALLAAAGLGDLGQRFPDTDPQWAGANSAGPLATRRRQWCANDRSSRRVVARCRTISARRVVRR